MSFIFNDYFLKSQREGNGILAIALAPRKKRLGVISCLKISFRNSSYISADQWSDSRRIYCNDITQLTTRENKKGNNFIHWIWNRKIFKYYVNRHNGLKINKRVTFFGGMASNAICIGCGAWLNVLAWGMIHVVYLLCVCLHFILRHRMLLSIDYISSKQTI